MNIDDSIVNQDGLAGFYHAARRNQPSIRINKRGDEIRVKCGRIRKADAVYVRVYDAAGNMEYVQKDYGFGKYGLLASESPLSPAITGARQQLTIPVTSKRVLGGRPVKKVEAVVRDDDDDVDGGDVVEKKTL